LKGQKRVEFKKSFNIGLKRFPVKPYSHDCSLFWRKQNVWFGTSQGQLEDQSRSDEKS